MTRTAVLLVNNSPLALPTTLRNRVQWRIQTVSVIADVTVVTEEQTAWIRGLPALLTHCAFEAPPAFA